MARDARLIIDTGALKHNLSAVRRLAPDSRVMAVIKANGYGHGLETVAHALQTADGFALTHVSEARQLRAIGFNQPILLLEGPFDRDELLEAIHLRCQIVVHQIDQLNLIQSLPQDKQIAVWLKINTGMNRLGFLPQEAEQVWQALKKNCSVEQVVLMTHMANAEIPNEPRTREQVNRFQAFAAGKSEQVSLANSGMILRYPGVHSDWVRPGIMLYGSSPDHNHIGKDFMLQPTMTLTARIIAIQTLKPGDQVGYGGRYQARAPMRLGVVGIGYGDGYPRAAREGTPVSVKGVVCPLAGRVSMDMLTIDLSGAPQVQVGDVVELWGNQVPVEEVARYSDTISYELFCRLTSRLTYVH